MFIFEWLEPNAIGEWVRSSVVTFYVLEAIHVIGIVLLFGSLAIMDLRLIGVILRNIPTDAITNKLRPLTLLGFALAAATGAIMFLSSVSIYVANTQFWLKMGVIALAGANMLVFEYVIAKRSGGANPSSGFSTEKLAGMTSLLAWTIVIGLGRWIGFTKSLPMELPADFVLPVF